MRHLKSYLLAVSLVLFAICSYGQSYGVQVGAFKSVPPAWLEQSKQYGQLFQIKDRSLTSIIIGSYESRADAEELMQVLRNNGYPDAYIRTLAESADTVSIPASYQAHHEGGTPQHSHPHFDSEESGKWQQLSDEQRKKAVYLDGKLHLKNGDNFEPID